MDGIALTDHEVLAGHIKADKYRSKAKEKNPNFKIALGNEIYLCKDRSKNQKYYHFILIAKNAKGHRLLRELSSRAWLQSYYDRGMERVVTTYDDLEEIVNRFPDSIIATNACLGGILPQLILELTKAENEHNDEKINSKKDEIIDFIFWCKKLFGNDFYLEIAPGQSKEQIIVNKRMKFLAKTFNLKMIVATDAHCLKKEDRYAHESYLNSKDGEREVSSFYEYAYLQTNEEIVENLAVSGYSEEEVMQLFQNSMEIYDKIEEYTLAHKQIIPNIDVLEYPIIKENKEDYPEDIFSLLSSNDKRERYWINECLISLKALNLYNQQYINRLNEEARIIKLVGNRINDCLFSYFNTMKHFIDLFWKCGSIVGPGRGSATGYLSNYLLGITQLEPIQWGLKEWRFLNEATSSLPDVDIDIAACKRPYILQKIKEEREKIFNQDIDEISRKNLGCTLIATFGTESTKSAIQSAARGYRSEEYPNGIDSDTALYISSLVPSERGFLYSLNDLFYGNKEKDRKPNQTFINEIENFPGLKEIIFKIDGIINKRSSHASGVLVNNEDPYEHFCYMKTPKGEIITQWDLVDLEYAGGCKYDFLITTTTDKLIKCLELLEENKKIEHDSLRNLYNKYLHPQSINIKDSKIWDALAEGNVIDVFQFNSGTGLNAAKKIKPRNPEIMTQSNAVMRLMASDKEAEQPIDRYIRFKNNFPISWEQEMNKYHITKEEKELIKDIYEPSYGCPSIQEDLMMTLIKGANFTLEEADWARKIVAKKKMDKIPELREKMFNKIKRKEFAEYLWNSCIALQLGYAFNRL